MYLKSDLHKLIDSLPLFLQKTLNQYSYNDELTEIILDLGRRPEARFISGPQFLSQKLISWQDIDYITKRVSKFSNENRAGIEQTLHRISCIRNRQFLINGITCRIGRSIFGTISVIRDLVEFDKSILILGKPGVGKTTIIREISRVLSDEIEKRVIIIDTSNEIAGDSDISHLGIGRARRMQVPKAELQHQIMIEAVENHMPQVIIIDEIGTDLEVLTERIIAEKGVQLVGTTHGNSLQNLINNPSLSDLIGGIQYVTLSDEEAKRRGTQKSILERKACPTFEIILEINETNLWTVHENVKDNIDLLLLNNCFLKQTRQVFVNEKIEIKCRKYQNNLPVSIQGQNTFNEFFFNTKDCWNQRNRLFNKTSRMIHTKQIFVYAYSISHNFLQEVFKKINENIVLTHNLKKASAIIGLKKHLKQNFKLIELAQKKGLSLYSFHQLSIYQLTKFTTTLTRDNLI